MEPDDQQGEGVQFMEGMFTTGMSKRRLLLLALLLLSVLVLTLPPGFPLHLLATGFAQQIVPTATPDLPLSARELYLDVNASWSQVTVDGRKVSASEVGMESPLVLTPGVHHLAWSAAPFPAQSCQISIPASITDTCERLPGSAASDGRPAAPVVQLGESTADLPAAAQSSLLQAIRSALARLPSTTVQPGESYVKPGGIGVATDPFNASLTFQLVYGPSTSCQLDLFSSADNFCIVNGQDCGLLCSLPLLDQLAVRAAGAPAGWLVLANVYLTWTYRSLDGKTIATGVPLSFGVAAASNHLVMLSISRDSAGWWVRPVLGDQLGRIPLEDNAPTLVANDPACAAALDLTDELWAQDIAAAWSQEIAVPEETVHVAADADPSDGCVVTTGSAVFLVRFGIVIPATLAAWALQRTLGLFEPGTIPAPTPYEQHVIQRLMTLPGVDFRIPLEVS